MPVERQVKASPQFPADHCCLPDKCFKLMPLYSSGYGSKDMDMAFVSVVIMQGSRPGDGGFQPFFKTVHHLSCQLLHV
jgi:hypothetical protein